MSTPKLPVKRPRSAFVKRDIQRMMREYEEAEQLELLVNTPSTLEPMDLEDTVSDQVCMEINVTPEEPKTKSVASQKSLSRPPQRSHYTQTKLKGKDKECQVSGPKTREIGVMCDIIPSPQRQLPRTTCTVPLPDPSPATSDPGSIFSENSGSDKDYEMESDYSTDSEGEDDRCPLCAQITYGQVENIRGSCISVQQDCAFCQYKRVWTSQGMVGSVPSGNLAISCALLYSGSLPTKALRFLDFLGMPSVSYSTFMSHQKFYLQPVILDIWTHQQEIYFEETRASGKSVCIGGDGRADTPGHSAKYGSYTVMDLDCGKVIDVQLVQSNEVKSSCHMEKEGLVRAIHKLHQEHVVVDTIVTDRHVQIKKWVRETMVNTRHCFDVWHVAKGLKKKLVALAKEKECDDLHRWIKSITNHLYWVASSTPDGNGDLMLQKWSSIGNHIQNLHDGHGSLFPVCTHGPIDPSRRTKKWLKPGTKVCEKLGMILTSQYLKRDIPMLSTGQQTSNLESYHSVINHFAPKMIGFSYHGMQSRLLLAALHFNENVARAQASLPNGDKGYSITFPKLKMMISLLDK
ncbi:uncharacterized protein [Argopecten irradians]|uniref:uncharacterized protein n=1 Tax=Argopecten irradians TaxID=31199 RepID=UPI003722DC74